MAHPNNTHPYYNPSATGGWDTHLPPDVSPMEEPSYAQTPYSLEIDWEMVLQSAPRVGQWSDLCAPFQPTFENYEPIAPAPSCFPQVDGYTQPLDTNSHLPMFPAQFQPDPTNFLSQDSSLADGLTLDVPVTAPTSDGLPLDHWVGDQREPPSSTIYPTRFPLRPSLYDFINPFPLQNVQPDYRLDAGLAGTEQDLVGWPQPYETHCAPQTGHANAEAGPSTLVPPLVQHDGQQDPRPSGGFISETSANAEQPDTVIEQVKVSRRKGKRAKRPTQRWARGFRLGAKLQPRLIAWAEMRTNGREHATLSEALSTAIEAIKTIRPVAYPRYITRMGAQAKTQAAIEERGLFEDLSSRYPPDRNAWTRPDLLERVLEDLETYFLHPAP